jgi:hypothetical protein
VDRPCPDQPREQPEQFRWGLGWPSSISHGEEAPLLFWPVVIVVGAGFVALYYDHDVKPFTDQSACEQTLPELEQRAKEAKEFINAIKDAAGNTSAEIVFQVDCIDKPPQDFQRDLNSLQDGFDDGADI